MASNTSQIEIPRRRKKVVLSQMFLKKYIAQVDNVNPSFESIYGIEWVLSSIIPLTPISYNEQSIISLFL